MKEITIVLIALSLAMDAFAVSISNGVSVKGFGRRTAVRQAVFFGGFQFMMPLIGWALGSSVKQYIETVDHWIAFILLAVIGANMIRESRKNETTGGSTRRRLTNRVLLLQAVATSIDALAVGISFAILEVNIVYAGTVIGMVAFGMSLLGAWFGRSLGNLLQTRAELLGGVVLVLIGMKILLENIW